MRYYYWKATGVLERHEVCAMSKDDEETSSCRREMSGGRRGILWIFEEIGAGKPLTVIGLLFSYT